MEAEPCKWRNFSPGDLSCEFPSVDSGCVSEAVDRAQKAFPEWSSLCLDARMAYLAECRENLKTKAEDIAHLISRETGKPLREARLEMSAVIGKFDLTFEDGEKYLRDVQVEDGPHPARVRQVPRGPAAVIAPFNFPVHLGHGATVAYLLAGNTVVLKPSPFAVNTGLAYALAMESVLPEGVFQLLPGWGGVGQQLCLHRDIRSVCFTGSVPVGKALSAALAEDYSKCLALELGGKNSVIICKDADPDLAATAVADGLCLTAGQRCNATARVLVHRSMAGQFLSRLESSLSRYVPADPLDETTMLGPLISFAALDRYEALLSIRAGDWIIPGGVLEMNSKGQHGYYVMPAVMLATDKNALDESRLAKSETFAPVLVVEMFDDESTAIRRHESWAYGLTASIFTSEEETFARIGNALSVGNLYRNLPTTFSPSTLPFGGWGASGNGRPGARGFIRFAVKEQALQWKV